jgi:polyferredoxin
MKRQSLRRGVLAFSYILFPLTFNYLSPYLAVTGAASGILSGSLILFLTLFAASIFIGRSFCGWVCPGSGLQEFMDWVGKKKFTGKSWRFLKWVLWFPWFSIIVFLLYKHGTPPDIKFLYMTENIVSIDEPAKFITYFLVTTLIILPGLINGRRGFCHHLCWMAPFMISGMYVGEKLKIRRLRITATESKCTTCGRCSLNCSMSIPVSDLVFTGVINQKDCILCGDCVDGCKSNALKFTI